MKPDACTLNVDRPSAHDAEAAVLGGVLVHNELLAEVAGLLAAQHFGQPWCRLVYVAMLALAKENKPIDYVTLRAAIGSEGIERIGLDTFARLGEGVPRSMNVRYYADLVIDAARRRAAIGRAMDVVDAAVAPTASADDVISKAQEAFFRLAQTRRGETLHSAHEMTTALYRRLEAADEQGHAMTGLETSIHDLDAMTHGLQGGELVVLGARPSIGKTGLALQVGLHVARSQPVLFCSLEMGQASIWERALFNMARVDGFRFKRGHFKGDPGTDRRISRAMNQLDPLLFWLDEQPAMSSVDVRSKAQQVQLRHGLKLVVVDYLQLMRVADPASVRGQNRAQIVGDMAKDLKEIARTLNVAVLVLSQLRRTDERPTMNDLRESGDIEAHADIILLLHRAKTRDELHDKPAGEPITVELLVEKQRGNPTGLIKLLNFREEYRFASAARGDVDPHDDSLLDRMETTV
jgi:replicative DNA helicase